MVGLIVAVYWRVAGFGFVHYDDLPALVDNPAVRSGLTSESLKWAFTSSFMNNWVPLARVSHLLDITLFGFRPAGHHLVSVLLQVFNTLLVFHVLHTFTGQRRTSAFVAAVYALHPQHVESVVWISARRELLKDFFGLATLWAYGRQVRRPGHGWGIVVGVLFLGALLSKPTLVILPLVLLLVDFWPLGRCTFGPKSTSVRPPWQCWADLVLQKAPLFALSLVVGAVAYFTHRGGMVLEPMLRMGDKISHALTSYAWYLEKTFWPVGLAVIYPYRLEHPLAQLLISVVGLSIISYVALALRFRAPQVTFAWLWALVTLLPVVGLVQTGVQATADRYTTFAHIGVAVGVTWFATFVIRRRPAGEAFVTGACGIVLLALGAASVAQVRVWRDDRSLFGHAVSVTRGNWVALNNLGMVHLSSGENETAARHFQEAINYGPVSPDVHNNLGLALFRLGRYEQAAAEHSLALQAKPTLLSAHLNLGRALQQMGREDRALAAYLDAYRLSPGDLGTRVSLGSALARRGRSEAVTLLLYRGTLSAMEVQTVINSVLEEMAIAVTEESGLNADRTSPARRRWSTNTDHDRQLPNR